MPTDDSDPAIIDWGEQANTTVDDVPTASELPTAPHRSLDWLAGRKTGIADGVERVVASFLRQAARFGVKPTVAIETAARLRKMGRAAE